MEIAKILVITILCTVAAGCFGGLVIGKYLVNRKNRKSLLSRKEMVLYSTSALLGAVLILVGVFYNRLGGDTPEPGMEDFMDNPGMEDGMENPDGVMVYGDAGSPVPPDEGEGADDEAAEGEGTTGDDLVTDDEIPADDAETDGTETDAETDSGTAVVVVGGAASARSGGSARVRRYSGGGGVAIAEAR